ncbi:MAG: hypothetical protein ABSB39_23620, partial [Candidatus Sulfotelmatobacter sp.]
MSTSKSLLSSLLMLAFATAPALAGSNDAKPANENAANAPSAAATSAEAAPAPASPSLAPTAGDANVTALLGVLVMKGVLAPNEANAIRNAAPEAEFQLLVQALSRKGVLSAADLSAATKPATQPSDSAQPSAPAAAPAEARETVSAALAGREAYPSPQNATKPMA